MRTYPVGGMCRGRGVQSVVAGALLDVQTVVTVSRHRSPDVVEDWVGLSAAGTEGASNAEFSGSVRGERATRARGPGLRDSANRE